MIKFQGLKKAFANRKIIDSFSGELPDTGMVGIVGSSGCGKTTLLSIIGGLDGAFSGRVSVNGMDIAGQSEEQRCRYRQKNIGIVFQDFRLFPLDNVENNVLLPLTAATLLSISLQKRKVADLLALVGLSGYQKKLVTNLSGGEKQRVAVARSLVNDPKIILADEPTGALDEKNAIAVLDILKRVSQTCLVIVASHEKGLLSERADIMWTFTGGEIKTSITDKNLAIRNRPLPIIKTPYSPAPAKIPLSFLLRHSYLAMKAKKGRTFISDFATSLALLGVGLALTISSSIGTRIKQALTSAIGEDQIIMTLRNDEPRLYYDTFAAPLSEMEAIVADYPDYLNGIGVTYLANFENFFRDGNALIVASTPFKEQLPSFSIRLVNDFTWLDEENSSVLPFRPPKMENDEVVLGLPVSDLISLCAALKIQKDISSLSAYVATNELLLAFDLLNESWVYEDQQILTLVGVFASDVPKICHANPLWNQWMFEASMRFPSTDNLTGTLDRPWIMRKAYYFHTLAEPTIFLDEALFDERFHPLILERFSSSYGPGLCPQNGPCQIPRVLAFVADKNAINLGDIAYIRRSESQLKSMTIGSVGGYAIYPSSLMMGFASDCYFSPSQSLIEETIDATSVLSVTEQNAEIILPKGVLMGNVLQTSSGGVRFSGNLDDAVFGRSPKSSSEIAISEKMAARLYGTPKAAIGKILYMATVTAKDTDSGGTIHKTFATPELTIVGVMAGDNDCLHHDERWPISFFRDQCGVSASKLIPTAVSFSIGEFADSAAIIARLNRYFPRYDFSNPANAIADSVDQVTGYAEKAMLILSSLAIAVATLLLGFVTYLHAIENRGEFALLWGLGISRKASRPMAMMPGFLLAGSSWLSSAIQLALLQIVLERVLDEILGVSFSISFAWQPFLATAAIAIIISTVSGMFASIYNTN